MRRAACRLACVVVAAVVCLLALSSAAFADRFPASGAFNGLVITYSVSGAQLGTPVDSEGFTTSRAITGKLSGGRLEVSGTVEASGGWSAAVTVTVSAGENSKSFSAASPPAPNGLAEAPWSQSFTVGVDVPKGASGSVDILLTGEYNAGGRALEVAGTFEGGGSAGGTATTIGGAGGTSGGKGHKAGKIPGPGTWWKVLVGALVPGLIAGGLSLTTGLVGGGGVTPVAPRRKNIPPPDAPRLGPAGPYRETPDGPLIYPPGTQPPPGAKPPGGPPKTESGFLDDPIGAGRTLVDAGKALGKGIYDFGRGTLNTIVTGYEEIGLLGFELTDSKGPSVLKELYHSPSIIPHTLVNIGGEILEGVNPTEELKSLNDPNMSPEGKAWAISSIALKAANALLIKDSLKTRGLGENPVPELPEFPPEPVVPKLPEFPPEPAAPKLPEFPPETAPPKLPEFPPESRVIKAEPLKTPPDPAARTSKMTPSEATAQAEKMVPAEKAAEFDKFKTEVDSAVDNFSDKVKSGEPITPEDVLDVTKDPASTRQVLGKKGERPVSPEVTDAVKQGRRKIYDGTDKTIAEELKKNPKYAEGDIKAKEVSTGGEADATGSTDRDVMYVHEKQVIGKDGKLTTVEEPVPAKDVEAVHDEAFAKETKYEPPDPPDGVDPAAWREAKLREHAEQYGQNVIDRENPEFIVEYRADGGPGKLTSDPAEMGKIYQEVKFKDLWEKGTPGKQTEALEQLGKAGDAAKSAAKSKGRVLDPQTVDALDIVKKGGDPAVVDQAVKNLGVQGGVEGLSNRLRSIIESKKWK